MPNCACADICTCKDRKNNVRFLNPVLLNPWRSLGPMGFWKQAKSSIKFCVVDNVQKTFGNTEVYPRKLSKREHCVLSIYRLHPEIRKTKIRAALTLCEGDVVEAIRLLNACLSKLNMTTVSSPCIRARQVLQPKAVCIETNTNRNRICKSPAKQWRVAPLGSFPRSLGVKAVSNFSLASNNSISLHKRSTVAARSSIASESSLDVYEFSEESEDLRCDTYPKITRAPRIKVGVVLKRNPKGKYTATIM